MAGHLFFAGVLIPDECRFCFDEVVLEEVVFVFDIER